MRRAPVTLAICTALLAGCSDFPDFGEPLDRARTKPEIIDIFALGLDEYTGADDERRALASVQARVAALRARARQLQQPVIDRRTRIRMERAVKRHAS